MTQQFLVRNVTFQQQDRDEQEDKELHVEMQASDSGLNQPVQRMWRIS